MKIEEINFPNLERSVIFTIGNNAKENHEIIDLSKENDMWFHVDNLPSCHVVASLPDNITKKELKSIIKKGAEFCKQYSKYSSHKNLHISYTLIKNVKKTKVLGSVILTNHKIIVIYKETLYKINLIIKKF